MTPVMLRQFWTVVENTQSTILTNLDDGRLVTWLLNQVASERPIDPSEATIYSNYIRSRLNLIRDLAEAR
ncbi:MAG: hypothetical protein VKK04_19435 [Synechococcales bacterium]|nr:hypothetical protein [Synechococcales bacterium]